jgi:putative ABC transport system permease protein
MSLIFCSPGNRSWKRNCHPGFTGRKPRQACAAIVGRKFHPGYGKLHRRLHFCLWGIESCGGGNSSGCGSVRSGHRTPPRNLDLRLERRCCDHLVVWFGVPAIHAVRRDLRFGLAGTGKGPNEDARHGRLRSGVSIVLLVGTGLMVRSLLALERINLGFNPANVLYVDLALPEGRYESANQIKPIFRKILDRVEAIPGVTAAAEASSLPPYSWGHTEVEVQGKAHSEPWGITFNLCSEGYFQTLGRRLLKGRLLTQRDVDSGRHALLINEALARAYFRNENPVGHEIRLTSFEMYYPDWPRNAYFEIIGIVADTNNSGLQAPPRPEAYLPHTLTAAGNRMIVMRTAGNSAGTLTAVRQAITAVDADIAISEASDSATKIVNRSNRMIPFML